MTSWLHYFIIQLQSNTKDDYVTIHKNSPKAGSESSRGHDYQKFLPHGIDTVVGTQRATTAWYKLKSRVFPASS